jgi:hypothetical protein
VTAEDSPRMPLAVGVKWKDQASLQETLVLSHQNVTACRSAVLVTSI